MDRFRNPALWCALIVTACAAVLHSGIFSDGSIAAKLLMVLSEITGAAGSLLFGAGLALPPAGKLPASPSVTP